MSTQAQSKTFTVLAKKAFELAKQDVIDEGKTSGWENVEDKAVLKFNLDPDKYTIAAIIEYLDERLPAA